MTKKQHLVSSIVLIIGTGLLFFSCVKQLGETTLAIHPYLMPSIMSGLMLFLSVIRLIAGLLMPKDSEEDARKRILTVPIKSLICMVLIGLYAAFFKKLGFIVSSFLFMLSFMFVLNDEPKKTWWLMIVMALVMSVGMYYLFVNAFYVMLPAGILTFL